MCFGVLVIFLGVLGVVFRLVSWSLLVRASVLALSGRLHHTCSCVSCLPLFLSATMSKRKNADITTDSAKKPRSIASFFVPQASVPASATATKFDKSTWVAKLDPETRTLLQLEIDTLHDSWLGALQDELKSPEFLSLKRFLKKEKDAGATIYPPEPDIYSWYVYPVL